MKKHLIIRFVAISILVFALGCSNKKNEKTESSKNDSHNSTEGHHEHDGHDHSHDDGFTKSDSLEDHEHTDHDGHDHSHDHKKVTK